MVIFLFSSSDCFLYIRVYDCFSVWSQKLKYESEGNEYKSISRLADEILM